MAWYKVPIWAYMKMNTTSHEREVEAVLMVRWQRESRVSVGVCSCVCGAAWRTPGGSVPR